MQIGLASSSFGQREAGGHGGQIADGSGELGLMQGAHGVEKVWGTTRGCSPAADADGGGRISKGAAPAVRSPGGGVSGRSSIGRRRRRLAGRGTRRAGLGPCLYRRGARQARRGGGGAMLAWPMGLGGPGGRPERIGSGPGAGPKPVG
jgi:hypothetical protein